MRLIADDDRARTADLDVLTCTRSESRGRGRRAEGSRVVKEVDARYVDADGDGLLDAVELVERVVVVQSKGRRVVSTTRTVAAEIGDDGIPHRVTCTAAAS